MAGTCVLLRNALGEYLMQFRDGTPDIPFPLAWDFFGGTIEEGETPLENILRELPEELGISAGADDLVKRGQYKGITVYEYQKPIEWGEFKVFEGAGCAFFSVEEVRRLDLPEHIRAIAEKFL